VQLYLFDLLHLDARSLVDAPYTERRRQLQDLGLDDEVVKTPPWWADDAGKDLMQAAADQGLEGVVAKRLTSPYQPGVRSRRWIKAPLNQTTEVVIAGWKPGEGRRTGTIGSLVLGAYDPAGRLVFTGGVGTGFTEQRLTDLARQLRPCTRPPRRSTCPYPANTPAARSGSGPASSARWNTATAPRTAAFAIQPGADCARTGTPPRSGSRSQSPEREPGGVDERARNCQTGVVTSADMTTPTPNQDHAAESVCCGHGGAWAPGTGKPTVIGCMLCPKSPTYWRNNRADDRPYQPVRPIGEGRLQPRPAVVVRYGRPTWGHPRRRTLLRCSRRLFP
jgi:hypothetical protein